MNQKNFEYLRDQVKYTGFGEGLENELREKLQQQSPEFQLNHNTKFGNDEVSATLHFRKSEQTDMYFFNKYQVSLTPEHAKDKMEQSFYINREGSVTLKEAYNLMNGRAVNKDLSSKEGQAYNAWLQMDFKQTDAAGNYKTKLFHQNYGFDLQGALEKHPIKELGDDESRKRLLQSLERGNRQSVTFIKDGHEQKHSIEANPQFKTINIYDSNQQRVFQGEKKGEKASQVQSPERSQKQGRKTSQPKEDSSNINNMGADSGKKRRKSQSLS